VDKSSINRLLKKLRDASTVNRLIAADYEVQHLKMLIMLTIWFWVNKIRHRLIQQSVKSHARQAFS